MKKLICTSLVILLSACATSGTEMQAECEGQYTKFSEIYWCTYEAIAKRNQSILTDARAKLYLLRGEQLAQEVDDGKISSLDAKVLWQKLYVELKTAKDQEIAAGLSSLTRSIELSRAAFPTVTPTLAPSPQIHCTSQSVGHSVFTNCQ